MHSFAFRAFLLTCLLFASTTVQAQPELVEAFIFGSRSLDCSVENEPGTSYTMVLHDTPAGLEYSAGRGWGYEVVNPGAANYAIFGPFDDSPNNRNAFPDTCPHQIYDSFIGAKNFDSPCAGQADGPCNPPEGLVFRVDVPNGTYRFVAAAGSADNDHTTRIVVENGGSGDPSNISAGHVVLVHNHDQGAEGAGVFARVGFDDYLPPAAAVNGWVDQGEDGMATAGGANSPTLEVTDGYIRLHQLKGATATGDPNGGNMVVLELWRVEQGFNAISAGSTWKYFPGEPTAANPPADWQDLDFDDSAWNTGDAPVGYGETSVASDLSLLDPPMRSNYSTAFMRQTFELSNATAINQLTLRASYDDGFVIWINGIEMLRQFVAGADGTPVAHDAIASSSHESGSFEDFELPNPRDYLVDGTNVVAVQIVNSTINSSDVFFDCSIFDPVAPDLSPPEIASITPSPGTTVRSLSQIQVMFSEGVTGVSADDLEIDGSPATNVSGSDEGPYIFSFPAVADGGVDVEIASGHGITDLGDPANDFAGRAPWSYTVDPSAPVGELVINEIMAVNGTGLNDEDGDESDWIEIRNTGATSTNLSGWSLSDDEDEPELWTFPNVSIPSGGYLIVFASGKDRRPTNGELHANFKLGADGEFLGLYNNELPRQVVSQITPRYPRQRSDYSWGPDNLGELVYFASPTPGAANSTGTRFDGFVLEPHSNPGRGFFDAPFLLTLSSGTPDAQIRYTTDGTEPSPTRGTVYGGPFQVAGTANKAVITIRAIAYESGKLPSDIVTFSYIFPEHVLTQPDNPQGFPAIWQGLNDSDYEMDSRVVNDPGHRELIRDGLLALPTLSIVTDVDNLFDPSTGIYTHASSSGSSWERPVSAEFIYPDGSKEKQLNCGLRMQGGSSVNNYKVIKFSMRLLFKGDYGPTKLRHELFPDSASKEFNTIVLDAHMNQTWQHPSHGQRVRGQYVRDQFNSDLQHAMGGFAVHDKFFHIYLNGLYWGIFDLHERADADFAAATFGGEPHEYDAMKHSNSRVVDGSSSAFNSMLSASRQNLSSNTNYEALQDWLDVPRFIDYMLVNFYTGNDDWDHHNWYASRKREPGAGYLFHSWDAEHSLKSATIDRTGLNNGSRPTEIFQNLRANAEFRLLFADHVHRHLFNGGPLYVNPSSRVWSEENPENNNPANIYMQRIQEIWTPIACEAARWGDTRRSGDPYTRNDEWMTELNWQMTQFFPNRTNTLLAQLRNRDLYPSVNAPVFSTFGGRIESGFSLTMTRSGAGTIYYTTDGSDPRSYGSGNIAPTSDAYSGAITLNDHTIVKARTRSGTTWSALTEATFSLRDIAGALAITEIMYNPVNPSLEFLELKNTADTTIGLTGAFFNDGVSFFFDENVLLAAGEHLLLVADPAAFSASYPGVDFHGSFVGSLSNGGEELTIRDRFGDVVLSFDYDDEGRWPVGPDGFGYSLVLDDESFDPDEAESWRASRNPGGSPGENDPPALPHGVVINEILAHSSSPLEDAIEVYNPTASSIDIGGWYLSGNRDNENALQDYRIPGGTTIASGDYAVFYRADFGFELASAGGAVYLSSANAGGDFTGNLVEGQYGSQESGVSFGRHTTTVGIDFTALANTSFGADFPANVGEFRSGTGEVNETPLFGPLVINELMYHPVVGSEEFVELYNPTGSAIALYDSDLDLGWRLSGIRNSSGSGDFEFAPGTTVSADDYLLVVGIDPTVFGAIHAIPGGVPIVGAFGGGLSNDGESVRLQRPVEIDGIIHYIDVDRVRFNDAAPWPIEADGDGPSLERILASSYGNDPANWDGSSRNGGTPGQENSTSNGGGNRFPESSFTASPPAGEAPLSIFFDGSGSYDLDGDIVNYAWDFDDGGSATGRTTSHNFLTPGVFTVTLTVRDNEGAESTSARLISVSADPGGGQTPGDFNQDSVLDISDVIGILRGLFVAGVELPCEDGIQIGGNSSLLDVNTDESVNLTDGVFLLNFLFKNGPTPNLGTDCVPMIGCPDTCAF